MYKYKFFILLFNDFCSDTAPLLNKSSSEHMFDTMAMEIEQLLTKVGQQLKNKSELLSCL